MHSIKPRQQKTSIGIAIALLWALAACKTMPISPAKNTLDGKFSDENTQKGLEEEETSPLIGSVNEQSARIELASKTATEMALGSRELFLQPFIVTADNLHIRSGPGENFNKIGLAKRGTLIKVRKIEKKWAKIAENQWVGIRHIKLVSP